MLITGENGVGKEVIADLIQRNSTVRAGPYVRVNAGALPSELLEAELFGAEAGAYTGAQKSREGRFEAADGGTLFLDEVGNLSAHGQAALLRVLQTGEFERLGSTKTRKVADLGLEEQFSTPPHSNPDDPVIDDGDEGKRLERVLARHSGVVAHAAAELGLSRQALYRRLRRHGLELERRIKSDDSH